MGRPQEEPPEGAHVIGGLGIRTLEPSAPGLPILGSWQVPCYHTVKSAAGRASTVGPDADVPADFVGQACKPRIVRRGFPDVDLFADEVNLVPHQAFLDFVLF